MSIGIKQCGIQIQKNYLRFPDGIDHLTKFAHDVIKLAECGIIHTVKKRDNVGCEAKAFLPRTAVKTGSLVSSSAQWKILSVGKKPEQ